MINDDRLPLKEKFLEYFKTTPVQKYAGAYIGKHEDTIGRWKEEDADFADQIELAKADYLKKTLSGVKSKEWILERLFNDHFAQKTKTDITSNGKELTPVLVKFLNDESNRDTK